MVIEIFADGLDREHVNRENHHRACRGVILREGKVLGEYFPKRDVFNLPGGGWEAGETGEECCRREVREETGYEVISLFPTVTVWEYLPEATFESHFFRCEVAPTEPKTTLPTDQEIIDGLQSGWYDLFDFLERLESYESRDPFGSNVHQRELIGLLNSI
ncbi:MAG TPA: NUDIX domain-containing protein [Bacillota bacterium]|nr:NUDIX domain-containing protein [Bacillota bacterium]